MNFYHTIVVAFFVTSMNAYAQTIEDLFLDIPGEKLGMKTGLQDV